MKKSELKEIIREEVKLLNESHVSIGGNTYNENELMKFIKYIYEEAFSEVVVYPEMDGFRAETEITDFKKWYKHEKDYLYKYLKDVTK